jgi:hypothetical protein
MMMTSEEILELARAETAAIAEAMRELIEGLDIVIDRQEASPLPIKAILLKGTLKAAIELIAAYNGTMPQSWTHLDKGDTHH